MTWKIPFFFLLCNKIFSRKKKNSCVPVFIYIFWQKKKSTTQHIYTIYLYMTVYNYNTSKQLLMKRAKTLCGNHLSHEKSEKKLTCHTVCTSYIYILRVYHSICWGCYLGYVYFMKDNHIAIMRSAHIVAFTALSCVLNNIYVCSMFFSFFFWLKRKNL